MNIVSASNEEDECRDRSERGGLLNVHENSTEGQTEALGDEDAVENDDEREEKSGRMWAESAHEVDYENEGGRESEF